MTLQECYAAFQGDYSKVLNRLRRDSLVARFLNKFPGDQSFHQMKTALEAGDAEEAFNGAHTLKGVSSNLQIDQLAVAANQMTELLRKNDMAGALALLPAVEKEYNIAIDAINEWQSSNA